MKTSTPNEPTFIFENLPLHWQMTRCEKYAFASLVEFAKPEVAIEIGTYQGGSLQVISKTADRVYSIDVSPDCKARLGEYFGNVEFLTGESKQRLPPLLKSIMKKNEPLGFVLIDGDHSADGVRNDINAVLQYVPIRPLYIVFHDSFHPPCRQGILAADWHLCPYIDYVEVDFIPGVYHAEAFDTAEPRSMYGGLSLAVMLPEKRTGEIKIHQSQKGLFETVFPHSRHGTASPQSRSPLDFLKKAALRLVAGKG
jgi:hypothetical protein